MKNTATAATTLQIIQIKRMRLKYSMIMVTAVYHVDMTYTDPKAS